MKRRGSRLGSPPHIVSWGSANSTSPISVGIGNASSISCPQRRNQVEGYAAPRLTSRRQDDEKPTFTPTKNTTLLGLKSARSLPHSASFSLSRAHNTRERFFFGIGLVRCSLIE